MSWTETALLVIGRVVTRRVEVEQRQTKLSSRSRVVDTRELTADEANATLLRSVMFSGARLVQTAYEVAQVSNAMPAQSVLLLQVSANLLNDAEPAQQLIVYTPEPGSRSEESLRILASWAAQPHSV